MNSDKKAEKIEVVLEALRKTGGNISHACKQAGVSRGWYYLEKNTNEYFAEQVDEISEGAIDLVESALMQQIQTGNTACIIFFLKTKGKERGYVERQEIDHRGKDGGAIQYETIPLEVRIAALEMLENGVQSEQV